jgi:hypothetical protein
MIHLQPNRTYKLSYLTGNEHKRGDYTYFRTLDEVPEAKLLIHVKDLSTGKIINLVDLLTHPWDALEEYTGVLPSAFLNKGNDLLSIVIGFLTTFHLWISAELTTNKLAIRKVISYYRKDRDKYIANSFYFLFLFTLRNRK